MFYSCALYAKDDELNVFITNVERAKQKCEQSEYFCFRARHVVRERRAEESNRGVIPRGLCRAPSGAWLCRASRTSVSEFRYAPAVSAAGAYISALDDLFVVHQVFQTPLIHRCQIQLPHYCQQELGEALILQIH